MRIGRDQRSFAATVIFQTPSELGYRTRHLYTIFETGENDGLCMINPPAGKSWNDLEQDLDEDYSCLMLKDVVAKWGATSVTRLRLFDGMTAGHLRRVTDTLHASKTSAEDNPRTFPLPLFGFWPTDTGPCLFRCEVLDFGGIYALPLSFYLVLVVHRVFYSGLFTSCGAAV